MFNIIHNAIIHGYKDSEIQISLSKKLDGVSDPMSEFHCSISNQGTDIPKETLAIFSETVSENSSYLGVGLSLVKLICDHLNYSISVVSAGDQITIVSIKGLCHGET